MMRSEKTRRRTVLVLQTLGIAAAYYGSGQIGLLRKVTVEGAVITPLWPPSGIALAALLYLGLRIWPGIALGAVCTVLSMSDDFSGWALAVSAGSALAPLSSCLALRAVGFRIELDRLRDGVALVFLGALGGMALSATAGAGVQLLSGSLSGGDFWPVWSAWWAGDAMGVLMVTPLLLVLRKARMPRVDDRWGEALLLSVVAVAASAIATRSSLSMIYLVFPVLVWAALRFQLAGSAPCALLVSVMAIVAGTEGVGPFAGHSVPEVMFNLCILNGSVALTALLLAAIVTEHNNIRRETEVACEELAALVEELTPRPLREAGSDGPKDGESR
ncbi:MASE1 domain-containing protein [Streptomyces sp. NPDC059166]|uniref:MASE1 domain-containing protein n=1 Tax=Streptomyces sp. NPDC059166 TaxID=3346752 RepID=UPI00367C289D